MSRKCGTKYLAKISTPVWQSIEVGEQEVQREDVLNVEVRKFTNISPELFYIYFDK